MQRLEGLPNQGIWDLSKVYLPEFLECVSAGEVLEEDSYLSPPGGGERIISVRDYVDNSFTALGSSDPREVRFEL